MPLAFMDDHLRVLFFFLVKSLLFCGSAYSTFIKSRPVHSAGKMCDCLNVLLLTNLLLIFFLDDKRL